MIAAWMFGATLFALLLFVAAWASERALRLSGRATRTPWAAAMILALLWPASAPFVLQRANTVKLPVTTIVDAPTSAAALLANQLPEVSVTWGERLGMLLLAAWIVASVVLLIRLGAAALVLSRITRRSRTLPVEGVPVLVTESLGPAVVGLWRPRVAVPEWFLELDAPLQRLVLQHELQHCRSRDMPLVWFCSVAVALMPWNAGLWMLARRTRLALEIDCDSRTLVREENAERYGKLLLLIAQRQSSFPLVSMLAESTSHLSQRIAAMHTKPLQRRAVRVVLFAGVATAAVAIACSPRIASDLTSPNARPQNAKAAKFEAEQTTGGSVYFESQVNRPATFAPGSSRPAYPAELKAEGVEGRVLLQFVVDTNGLAIPSTLKVLRSSHPAFTAAVQAALPDMRFLAAQISGRKVKQLVQAPMVFDMKATAVPGEVEVGEPQPTGTPPGMNVLEPMRAVSRGVSEKAAREASFAAAAVKATQPAPPSADARKAAGTPTEVRNQNGVYFESQVEEPVTVAKGSVGPKYPAALRASGKSGAVLVQFVVDESGNVDLSSFRVLKADDPLMEAAVREALPEMKFEPAKIGGRSVKQLVQQPFGFSLSR